MADFEIIEADFQQYYNLDISTLKFRRYARLLANLPSESRFVQKYSPFKDWNWDKEVQSQILHSIDTIATLYVNANRKKGTKPAKAPELVQPDYVADAKKQVKKRKVENNKEYLAEIEEIFKERNNKVKEINGT